MKILGPAWLIFMKDLRLEWRTREIITSSGLFAVLVVVLSALAFYTDPVSSPKVVPGVIWIAILFSGIVVMGRSWDVERDGHAFQAMLMSPVPRASFYLGKAMTATSLLIVLEIIIVPLCLMFFQVDATKIAGPLIALLVLGTLGFTLTGSMFAALTVRTSGRDVAVSVVVFSLVAPALLAAAVATRELFAGASLSELAGWLRALGAYDLFALGMSVLLFDHVFGEA